MGRKTILTCAVTGNLTSRDQHPGLPVTPKEIAAAAVGAAKAGAAIVHLHVRDPLTGKGSMDLALYDEVVARLRDQDSSVIINLTTGEGGRFIPSEDEPRLAAAGTTLAHPDARVAHVEKLKPELCSLDFDTMWSGQAAVINPPRSVARMAARIYAAGVRPEIEIFDSGDLHMAKHFLEQGILRAPLLVQFVLGVRYGAVANPETLLFLVSQLPPGSLWSGFGIGRHEFPMLAQAWLLGGHVRVGMEDNIYIRQGELCRDNAELVEKAVDLVELLGGSIASPDEARAMLDLT